MGTIVKNSLKHPLRYSLIKKSQDARRTRATAEAYVF